MSFTVQMRSLEADSRYEAPLYIPTDFVRRLNKFFSVVRFLHDGNFADFVSPQRDEQVDYTYGIIFFSTIIALIAFCWALVLIMLKCRGDGGCASGIVFETRDDGSHTAQEEGWITNGQTESREFDSSFELNQQQSGVASALTDPSFPSVGTGRNKKRATRTRIVFLIFGMGALASSVLFLVFAFAGIKENLNNTDSVMVAAQEIIDQIASTMRTVEAAGEHASIAIANTNLNFQSICPNAAHGKDIFGIDLKSFAETAAGEFDSLKQLLREHLDPITRTLTKVQEIKDDVKFGLEKTQTYSWILPAVLLGVAVVTTIVMLGVVLALRGRSGKRVQRCMTYGALPLLMVFCVVSWLATISAGIGAMSSGDACVAQGDPYGPDSTIAEILDRHNLDHNSTTYKMVYTYTNACRIENPTQELVDIEEKLQSSVNSIWLEIARIDGVGRTNVSDACGSKNLDGFLHGTRQLAKSLSTIRKAIDSTIGTLECKNINPIYVEAIREGICGNVVNGLGAAFMLLLSLSICLMVLITLRASWLHQRDTDFEDKVYDENDVAGNMIVNEHEEYLTYISRYKNEWEDYEGFDPGHVDAEQVDVTTGEGTESEDQSYSESYFMDKESASYLMDEESAYESSLAQSTLPDDISFPSLQVTPSNVAAAAAIMMIPALLPRAYSDEEEEQEIQAVNVLASDMSRNIPIPINILASNLVEGDIDVDDDTDPYRSGNSQPIAIFKRGVQANEGRNDQPEYSNDNTEFDLFATNNTSNDRGRSRSGRRPISSDEDSSIDHAMQQFARSYGEKAGHEDDTAMFYSTNLRTKESIEHGLALHCASSGDHHEFRDDDNESRTPLFSAPSVREFIVPQYRHQVEPGGSAVQTSMFSTQSPEVSSTIHKSNQLYLL